MNSWQPLSVREGTRGPDGPYEGIPSHLRASLRSWLVKDACGYLGPQVFWSPDVMHRVILRSRAPIIDDLDASRTLQSLVDLCAKSQQLFLDVIDTYLQETRRETDATKALRELLTKGGSVWTVAPDNASLHRAVAPQMQIAFERATSPADVASKELGEAWANAYGRAPDPSDAWDHSIKAVEAILQKIISPDNNSATLGTLIKNLREGAHKFEFVLTSDQGGVQTLLSMLQLMWPNPDRHGGPNGRTPTIEEARSVVQLAVTIAQWGRDGQIVKR